MKTALMWLVPWLVVSSNLSAAQIANGGPPPAMRIVQGRVVGMRSVNGGAVLQIRSGHGVNNLGAAGGNGLATVVQSFAIGPNTQFEMVQGVNRMAANAAMLRPGQRVMVQAQGPLATGVRIIAGNRYSALRRGGYYSAARSRGAVSNRAIGSLPITPSQPRVANHHHVSMPRATGRSTSKR
jgi:hypothetical protein